LVDAVHVSLSSLESDSDTPASGIKKILDDNETAQDARSGLAFAPELCKNQQVAGIARVAERQTQRT
jgi:hypothetical protein